MLLLFEPSLNGARDEDDFTGTQPFARNPALPRPSKNSDRVQRENADSSSAVMGFSIPVASV